MGDGEHAHHAVGTFSSSSSLRSSCAPAGACATPFVWLLLLKNAYASSACVRQLAQRRRPTRAARPRRRGSRSAAPPSRRARSTCRRCGRGSARRRAASWRRRASRARCPRRPSARRRRPSDHAPLLEPAQQLVADRPPRTTSGAAARRGTRRRRPGRAPTRGSRATTASRRRTAASGTGCPPSLPGLAQRRRARSRNSRKTAARASRGGRSTRPRASTGSPSRRSGGTCSSFTGWRVISPNAFTCITKPSGVRSAQPCTICRGRDAVVRRVDLDRREALGVVREALLRRRARRVPVLRERVVRPRARPDPDRRRHRRQNTERGPLGPLSRRARCAVGLAQVLLDDDRGLHGRAADGRVHAREAAERGRLRAGRSAEVAVEEVVRRTRSDRSGPTRPCAGHRSRSASPTWRSRMNEPVAPPTFLPPAVVVIVAVAGAAVLGHGGREA